MNNPPPLPPDGNDSSETGFSMRWVLLAIFIFVVIFNGGMLLDGCSPA
jgi:hypothetical protein